MLKELIFNSFYFWGRCGGLEITGPLPTSFKLRVEGWWYPERTDFANSVLKRFGGGCGSVWN